MIFSIMPCYPQITRQRAVFLDRDGVINQVVIRDGKPTAPRSMAEFEIVPDAVAACTAIHRAGYKLIVVTNQPDIATGHLTQDTLNAIHAHIQHLLPIDAVMTCPHTDADRCRCRKPNPGMLQDAAAYLHVDLCRSFMVGDRWRDITAGKNALCRHTILIGNGYGEYFPHNPTIRVKNLSDAAHAILTTLAP